MNEARRRFILSGLKLFDMFQLTVSFGLAAMFVAHWDQKVGLGQFLSMRIKLSNCAAFASILLTWHVIFSLCGLYESKRLSAKRTEILDLFKATMFSTGLLALIAALLRITMITLSFLASFWVVGSFLRCVPCSPACGDTVEISAACWLWGRIHERSTLHAESRESLNWDIGCWVL